MKSRRTTSNLSDAVHRQPVRTSGKRGGSSRLLLALILTLAPTALAGSTWYVNGVTGNDGNNCTSPTTACKTIGHAISLASSGDSIQVAAATYTENLTIAFNLRITGSAARTTIIDGGQKGPAVLISKANANVTLSNFTIRNGHGSPGGGIENEFGNLTVNNSTISGSNAYCVSHPCHNHGSGGGIFNVGTLTLNNSTVSGNTAESSGGGIDNYGTATITNSTISGNSPSYGGGGIANCGGTLMVNNSTVSGNGTPYVGGGVYNDDTYGGTVTLQNSIVANTTSGRDCYGTITSNGYNLSDDNTCNFSGPGDLNNTDPELGTLGRVIC
jgi:hypothetical protein